MALQGGGTLGACQGGMFQAPAKVGIAADWLIGTSIGAINAALTAGNRPDRLTGFWSTIRRHG